MKIVLRHLASVTLLVAATACVTYAQVLVPTAARGLRGATFGDVALVDYNADGFLDVLITGTESGATEPGIRLYRNEGRAADGGWVFAGSGLIFPDAARYLNGLRASSVSTGDFDNDRDVDFLVTGSGGTVVYRNNGAASLTAIPVHNEGLPARESAYVDIVTAPSSAWGDYDNDGDLDILLALPSETMIYRNEAGLRFVKEDVGLPPLSNAIVAWGDYDNDSDLDILAVSRPFQSVAPTTQIFRNDGGMFVDVRASLPGIEAGSVRWGDYDNDGDLDILITSRLPSSTLSGGARMLTGLYRNDRGIFRHSGDALPEAWHGEFLDVDGDGDLDLLLNGIEGVGTLAQIVWNRDGRFTERSEPFPGVWFGSVASGDVDGDGRTDLIMSGRHQSGRTLLPRVFFYTNQNSGRRNPPQAPHTLSARQLGESMVLTWHAPAQPADLQREAYSYNVRLGTSPGGSDILSPMSLPRGKRLVPGRGNAGLARRFIIRGLKPGQKYYWTVQSIDHRHTASPFASELSFTTSSSGPGSPSDPPIYTDNYPNPFNPSTTIRFTLYEPSPIRIRVFNVLGAEVASLYDSIAPAGVHEVTWNGRDARGIPVSSGVYLYAVESPDHRVTRSMLLLK